ncbi:translation initiation factor IF-2 [Pontibacter sp. BT310]|uniref:Translation initiation factor IF-2 n=1 Tax=Pontibacter populi TaxID=890055 RepID=A0ABS6XEJ0_9BACT|nr:MULTISPECIES: translation initiation factor IF-2 [Pontibacter]MBJ6119559.1 translation initiation factor IF-2 [Pontibacter sp. BT310]MBR0571986.1 translation initiation factor IF-2 [Microvirga sp. STS03]MBW3366412.1 translation initiation factor IF-2 [Pontibacter populi]
MAEEQTRRLKQVATTLNIGTSTIVDYLSAKGFDVENRPTTKITAEQFSMLAKEFASSMKDKIEAEELNIGKKPQSNQVVESEGHHHEVKKTAEPEQEIFIKTVHQPKGETAEPKAPEAPAPAAPAPAPAPEPKLPGIKVLGKIELDAKGNPVPKQAPKPAPAPAAPAPAPAAEKPAPAPAPVAEKPAAPAPEEKPVAPVKPVEKPAPAAEKPATPAPAQPAPPVAEKPAAPATPTPAAPVKPAAEAKAPEPTPAATGKPSEQEQGPIETITAKADQLKGLTVLGKIELPDSSRRKGTKPVASSDDRKGGKKKKRKRIIVPTEGGGQQPNQQQSIQNQNQRPVTPAGGNRPHGGGAPHHGGPRPGGGGGRNQPRTPFTPRPEKAEVTDKEIQEQIKATLAKLSGGKSGGGNRAKYRREKRSAIADATEERRMMEAAESKTLRVTEFVSANDLASLMNVSVNDVIKVCMQLGMFVSINQRLDAEAITIIADEFGYSIDFITSEDEQALEQLEEDAVEDLEERAPIVTIMGHVDHGKTSLLDYIRDANVTSGEAGGITQHIGAYKVKTESGRTVTFLDTPGHEAFTAMRARGAKVTDVVIIVVAADDSVMPQTKEAINHAQAAGVPIIIALNKIDKPAANPDKVREELAQLNILVEEWGGKYQSQEVSAKTGQGINDLLEKVLLEAELLELKANKNRNAVGTVIEAALDKGRGYVATMLVQTGTLKVGDIVLAGSHYGRVKAMTDHRGRKMKEAGPSTPVQLLGLDGAPQAGDKFLVMESEREAREIASNRSQVQREQSLRTRKHITLDEIGRRLAIGTFKELNVIVKGDVDGSVEALSDSLLKLSTPEVQVSIINKGVGAISESDVLLASASDAIIIGFQVRPSQNARKLAEQEQIDVRLYSIIYDAINEVKDAMEGMLAPTLKEEITGNAEVRDVFKITKVGTIAGCMVTDGTIQRNNKVRLVRDGIVVLDGEILALKRFKDDVSEVRQGFECGISLKNYNDIQEGDIIEAYTEKEVKRTL